MNISLFFVIVLLIIVSSSCQFVQKDAKNSLNTNNRSKLLFQENDPSKIFEVIKKNPDSFKAWNSLHHYSYMTDSGSSLSFHRDCFNGIKDEPLLFFERYLQGDEQALFRMVDAL